MNEKAIIDIDITKLMDIREKRQTPDIKVWEFVSSLNQNSEIWKHKRSGNIFEIII